MEPGRVKGREAAHGGAAVVRCVCGIFFHPILSAMGVIETSFRLRELLCCPLAKEEKRM